MFLIFMFNSNYVFFMEAVSLLKKINKFISKTAFIDPVSEFSVEYSLK